MLNNMKLINLHYTPYAMALVLLAGLSVLTGCKKDFLDRDPQGQYTQDDYPYPGGSGPYDTYLFGAYSSLRDYGVHSQSFIVITSVRSDDADKGSTPADGGADALGMDNFPVLPGNGMVNTYWTGHYTLINKCNVALDQVYNNADIVATPEVKLQSEAEAKFIRAYAYFNLVRNFGRVPLIDKVFTDAAAQSNVPQSEPAQVYALIESDLQFAATHLPASWDPKFVGRATSGAANGLLAKVYLTQRKWAQAMSTAALVMASGRYNLSTPYTKIFSEDGENSPESVFEVQATSSVAIPEANGVQYASIQGVRGSGVWNLGWGWNTPSLNLDTSYEAGDPRRTRTIMHTSQGTTVMKTIYNEEIPFGLPNPRYNQKIHTNPAMRAAYLNQFGRWMNVRVLRYADVVLMYAEAANETGNTAEALAKLELVRARARGGNNAILPRVTTTDPDELREAIRRERRFELAMEHDRFYDLVRWDIAGVALQAVGKTNFNNTRDKLLPIPQAQIDLSKGVLKQNPGY